MQPDLNVLILDVSLAGFGCQKLVDTFIDPFVTQRIRLNKEGKQGAGLPWLSDLSQLSEPEQKQFYLSCCSFLIGVLISSLGHVRVLSNLIDASYSKSGKCIFDVIFTAFVIASGTEGANSIVKFAQYAKDARGAAAQLALNSITGSDTSATSPAQSNSSVDNEAVAGDLDNPPDTSSAIQIVGTPGAIDFSTPPMRRPVLTAPWVQMLFWGSYWKSSAGYGFSQQVFGSLVGLTKSEYFSGLQEYGVNAVTILGPAIFNYDDPDNFFTDADVRTVVSSAIENKEFPYFANSNSAFLVITPPNICYSDPNVLSEHAALENITVSGLGVPFLWITHDGVLDTITIRFSHEMCETATDPDPSVPSVVGSGCVGGGASACEIADVCGGNLKVNGIAVQPYWSQTAQACVVPGAA